MIRVIIVEDEPAIARGLALLITQNHADFQVIALAKNGKEGLTKILEEKPDLVFVDIHMPVMDGLDMIREIRDNGFFPRCVILTGYAEFEYAQTAIRLGVSDYLLKPILPSTLQEILLSCRQEHQAKHRALQAEYLQRCLGHAVAPPEKDNPLSGCACTLLLLLSGPICSNVYNEALIPSEPLCVDPKVIGELEIRYQLSLFPLRGRHYNEYILAAVYPRQRAVDLEGLSEALYHRFPRTDACLNLTISDTATDGQGIYELSRDLYLQVLFTNPYGFGQIRTCSPLPNQKIQVSPEIKQICSAIPGHAGQEVLFDFLHSMFLYWQKEKVTQFQLTADLRYFISTVIHDSACSSLLCPDAAEMISSCSCYAQLEQELKCELERIYHFNTQGVPASQQSLARQVRNWLDTNFTSHITFKVFQDIFGHNEKYIAVLFKAEFGISPSKYIGELRLDMAKKLMQSNPDILLKDVAEMVGFTDAFYFSRVFKSHEGISPSHYVKNLKGT
ncbi:MAG TPA: DNA-binding response regulator [Lachnospiraceae bacterium]|nr:DNA-binding response regulator [Lachnospiraceae bacterium]